MAEASAEAVEFWKIEVSKLKASGLSLHEYAKQNGIVAHNLYYWKNKFEGRTTYIKKKKQFAEIQIPKACGFKIILPNGIIIESSGALESIINQLISK